MNNELTQRIERCIALETKCSEIYHHFCGLFPDTKEFWKTLAIEEEDHANILKIAIGYQQLNYIPHHNVPIYIVPESMQVIEESLELADKLKEDIKTNRITLKEALEIALKLEESIVESYVQNILTEVTDSSVIKQFQNLRRFSESHIKKIQDFIKII